MKFKFTIENKELIIDTNGNLQDAIKQVEDNNSFKILQRGEAMQGLSCYKDGSLAYMIFNNVVSIMFKPSNAFETIRISLDKVNKSKDIIINNSEEANLYNYLMAFLMLGYEVGKVIHMEQLDKVWKGLYMVITKENWAFISNNYYYVCGR